MVNLEHGHRLDFTVSIGAAILESSETNLMPLIKQADIALYQAKANGRNRVECYDPELDQSLLGELKTGRLNRLKCHLKIIKRAPKRSFMS